MVLNQQYHPFFVFLSLLVMVFSAYTTIRLLVHLRFDYLSQAESRWWWLVASFALGGGIFAMHFVAMLAFSIAVKISYDLGLTLLSMLVIVVVSAYLLRQVQKPVLSHFQLAISSVLVGLGISSMHYLGMEAVIASALMLYQPIYWIASIVIAVVVSAVAIVLLRYTLDEQKKLSKIKKMSIALLIAIGAATIHYSGMVATVFYSGGVCGSHHIIFDIEMDASDLAILVVLIAITLLAIALVISVVIEKFHFLLGENSRVIEDLVFARTMEIHQAKLETDLILDSMNEGVVLLDAQAVMKRVNQSICDLLGYDASELIDQPVSLLFADAGEDDHFLERKVLPLVNSKLQLAFNYQNKQFFENIEQAPMAVLIVDAHGHIISFNPKAAALFGYAKREVLYQSVHHLVPFHLRKGHEDSLKEFMHSARITKGARLHHLGEARVLEALHQNGSTFQVEIALLPFLMADTSCVVAALRDVEHDASWDNLMKESAFGEMITESNDEFASMVELQRKDGQQCNVLISGTSTLDEAAQITGAVLVFNDISKYLQAIKEVEKAEMNVLAEQQKRLESLGLMASSVAHDFNNLLTPIIGHVEMVMSSMPEESRNYISLQNALDAAFQAARLSKQMLSYSGSGRMSSTTMDVGTLIKGMQSVLVSSIAPHVNLQFNYLDQQLLIAIDVSEVEQVLLNMVINASDAMNGRPGDVRVFEIFQEIDQSFLMNPHTYSKPEAVPGLYIGFRVQDNGCGMSEEVQRQIFDPFFTTKFTGRGLGMSAALGVVYSNKGVLHIDSKVGVGTTFTVLFPKSEMEVATLQQPHSEEKSASKIQAIFQGKTILIIDDDDLVRLTLQARLDSLGCDVLHACDGQEGLAVYREHQTNIDAIILDMTMPVMDGSVCFKELQSIDPKVKVILSSGYADEDLLASFEGNPPAATLEKPYDMKKLKVTLARILLLKQG